MFEAQLHAMKNLFFAIFFAEEYTYSERDAWTDPAKSRKCSYKKQYQNQK